MNIFLSAIAILMFFAIESPVYADREAEVRLDELIPENSISGYRLGESETFDLKSAKNLNTFVVGDKRFDSQIRSDPAEINRMICQRWQSVGKGPTADFCQMWPGLQAKVDATAAVTGFPSPLLKCLYLQESTFQPGACSPKGACGLSQFMPDTAKEVAAEMRTNSKVQSDWGKYLGAIYGTRTASLDGASPYSASFSDDAIRGVKGFETADAQIFATTVYFRKYNKETEREWAQVLQENPSKTDMYFAYLLAGYNAGAGNPGVQKILDDAQSGAELNLESLPAETKKYVQNILDCMRKPKTTGWKMQCLTVDGGGKCN